MSGFKFDKNNEELDLSLGSDDGSSSQLPKPKVAPAAKKPTGLPNPSIPVNNPQPSQPVAKPKPAPVAKSAQPAKKVTPPTPAPTSLPKVPVEKTAPSIKLPTTEDIETSPVTPPPVEVQTQIVETVTPVEVAPPTVPPLQEHPSQTLSNIPPEAPAHAQVGEIETPIVPPVIEEKTSISVPQASPPVPTQPQPKTKSKKPVTKNRKAQTKGNSFKGNRKAVLFTRIGFGIAGGIILIAGVNAIFFPKSFPSQEAVIGVVKTSLNVTDFPAVKGNSFVLNFVETYFTYNQQNAGERDEQLSKYISKELLQKTDLVFIPQEKNVDNMPLEQTIIGVPNIVSVYSVNNSNAVYTVEVKLSTGSTLYVDVPVYWNPKNNGMAVSAPLSIMPAINKTEVPSDNLVLEWTPDKDVAESFEADLTKFLEAWAVSDKTLIDRYSTDGAELNVKLGLKNTVKLDRLDSLNVQGLDSKDNTVSETERLALIDVVWADTNAPQITYKQSYLLTIKQKPDKKWYVDKIDTTAYELKTPNTNNK